MAIQSSHKQLLAVCFSVVLLYNCFFLPGRNAVADDLPVIVFAKGTQENIIELRGLVEGITASTDVILKNETGKSFDHLLAAPTCGCLNTRSIDGKSLGDGEQIVATLVLLPTANNFAQSISITGVGDRSLRVDVGTFSVRGRVEPPVKLSKYVIEPKDIENGSLRVNLTANSLVSVDYSGIRLGNETKGIRMVVDEAKSCLNFSFDSTAKELQASIKQVHIPYTWNENSYTYTSTLRYESQPYDVSPKSVMLRKRSSESGDEFWFGKLLLRSRIAEIAKDELAFFYTEADAVDKQLEESTYTVREVNGSSVLVDFKIPVDLFSGNPDTLRIQIGEDRSVSVDVFCNL
ncbi:hypothetical protein SH449x_003106 [Pirellulaceae bacterium SH449]